MNQYTKRNTVNATYDLNGNLTVGVDGSTYSYDAQNRLISATKAGVTETFKYDALNRMVSRTTNGVPTYNIWDGWNLILTYDSSNNWKHAYLDGPGGMLLDFNATTGFFAYHYGDASGSTTQIADSTTGALVEWYRYDLQGTPVVYDANNNLRPGGSAYDTRYLFTGQQWDKDLGLYDLRNRFYSPDIGRFLQADPTGFNGDATNLYRYCGNNPVKFADLLGLNSVDATPDQHNVDYTTATFDNGRVIVTASAFDRGFGNDGPPGYGEWGGLSAFEFGNISFTDRNFRELGIIGAARGSKITLGINSGVEPNPFLNPGPIATTVLANPPYTTPINAVTYGNLVPINPYTNQPIWYPPGTSLVANAALAKNMNGFQYVHAVTHEWNYKNQGSAYEPFGNYNGGYTGRANGWPGSAVQILAWSVPAILYKYSRSLLGLCVFWVALGRRPGRSVHD